MGDVRFHYAAGLILLLILSAGPVRAQDLGGREAGGTAYYTFARPGQNTIEVLVLGGGQSGIYEIGEDINLGQLMALAGGGGRGGRRTKVRIHLYRLENGQRTKVLGEGIKDLAARSRYPSLQDGDVVRIETRERFNWRDYLRITSTVLGLTITILTLFDIRA
jgi:hypothetical protein